MASKKKVLNVFLLAMMNVAIILSLRGLPLMAKEGVSMIFYLLFALLIFLIPTSLVSAELATGWSKEGGVFRWVSEALGQRMGFMAIWLQWIQNVIWYPTILAFAAGALAYLFFSPELARNPLYSVVTIILIYWGATLINFCGMKASGWLSTSGVILGTILPGLLVIALGIDWWMTGQPISFSFDARGWIPDFSNFDNIAFLAGILLLFSGMEVNAVHALEVKNPKKSYPMAIFISVGIIFVLFFLGSMAVGMVIPESQISLTAGMMQAMAQFLSLYRIDWLVPIIGLFVAYGAVGSVAAWVVGPSKGLLATAKKGLLPPWLADTNARGVPVHILVVQGIIVTSFSMIFLFMPTVSAAFFILTALAIILYLVMYILLFLSAIILRYKKPNVKRLYSIPGGNVGMWIVAGVGILGALFAIVVGFFPPSLLKIVDPMFYVLFLFSGAAVVLITPHIIYTCKQPKWKKSHAQQKSRSR